MYDNATGSDLLIPQGARLIGSYSSNVQYGQSRLFVVWQRIVFPDGRALDIGAEPGADSAGYAGKTGLGVYADGMVEHDAAVGELLDKLKELGIEDNTIVMYQVITVRKP